MEDQTEIPLTNNMAHTAKREMKDTEYPSRIGLLILVRLLLFVFDLFISKEGGIENARDRCDACEQRFNWLPFDNEQYCCPNKNI